MDNWFNSFRKAKSFSKIDPTSRYSQICVRNKDIPETVLRKKIGSYKCVVLNFRMTNTPSTFSMFMKKIFQEHIANTR